MERHNPYQYRETNMNAAMKHTRMTYLACALALCACTSTETGTVVGTLAGAGLGAGTGAVIGHQSRHAGVGTAIGAGIGAPVGAAIGFAAGSAADANDKADRALAQSPPPQAPGPAFASPPPPPPADDPNYIVKPQPVAKQIIYPCPQCGVRNDVTDFAPGTRVRCTACGWVYSVPE